MTIVAKETGSAPAWRGLPAGQQPDWPDRDRLNAVTGELASLPPLALADESDLLRERLAAVTRGEAFVLQGGDCAETFEGATADAVRAKLQTLLQMALVLTYGASVPVVKIARLAGQFAKPRSSLTEPAAPGLPLFRGHAQPVPRLDDRRLRGPAPSARLEPGFRQGKPVRTALRTAGR
jgi:3-deoxy-7-phosphoheptulonate synthase